MGSTDTREQSTEKVEVTATYKVGKLDVIVDKIEDEARAKPDG